MEPNSSGLRAGKLRKFTGFYPLSGKILPFLICAAVICNCHPTLDNVAIASLSQLDKDEGRFPNEKMIITTGLLVLYIYPIF